MIIYLIPIQNDRLARWANLSQIQYIAEMKQRNYPKHCVLYSFTYLIYGILFSAIGPLIPYLADRAYKSQTQFSFVFFARATGMVLGIIIFNIHQSKKLLNYHQLIAASSLGVFLFCYQFTNTINVFWQAVSILFIGFFTAIIQTTINISTEIISHQNNVQLLFLIINGVFSLGGFLGPFTIYLFQENTYEVFGAVMLLFTPFYFMLQSSENVKKESSINHEVGRYSLPEKAARMLYLLAFMYLGLICSIGGWISSYAVLQEVNTKEEAVMYPSLFWGSVAFSRVFLAFIPGSSNQKMKICLSSSLATVIISLAIKTFGYIRQALIFQTLILGAAVSTIYPMMFSISKQFGYDLQRYQISILVAAGPVGEGLLTFLCGQLMKWIHIDMFFYTIIAYAAAMIWSRYRFISIVGEEEVKKEEGMSELLEHNNSRD